MDERQKLVNKLHNKTAAVYLASILACETEQWFQTTTDDTCQTATDS